jgi:predicted TIM-barrel fold metal-dependent hydrolase
MHDSPPSVSRRRFLAAMTATSATLGLRSSAAATAPSPSTARAAAESRRIDCQSHLFSPEVVALMEKRQTDPRVFTRDGVRMIQMGDWLRRIPPHYMDADTKLAAMDAAGIEMAALSINDPGPEWFGNDGPAVAQMLNDFVAGVVRSHPTRFFGLCVLPLQDMRASLIELDRCVRTLGMKGILLYTNLAGRFPDEPQFRPLFARATELDLPVLLHPAKPVTTEIVKEYEMTSTLGNMFDNTIALTRLIMSGILDEFPQLKLVCPHLGGTLPYIVGRLDHQVQVLKRGPRNLTRAPSEYLRSIWMDVVSPLPLAIRFGHDFIGEDRLLYSSDHPWVDPSMIVECVHAAGLSASAEEKIFSDNARKLFRL